MLIVDNPSALLKLSAYPDDELTITLHLDSSVSTDIQVIHLSKDDTSAFFKLTGYKEGLYTLSYELSGPGSENFRTPSPSVILVMNDPITAIGNYSNTIISSGCCEYDIPYQCFTSDRAISFTSSCGWQTLNSSLLTNGVVFLKTEELHLPLSISGLDMTIEDQSVYSILPSSLSQCILCEPSCNPYSPTLDELSQQLISNAIKSTFLNNSMHLLPETYSIALNNQNELNNKIAYSLHDFTNFFGSGQDLTDFGICNHLSVEESNSYAVAVINSPVSLNIGGNMINYFPSEKFTQFCVAVELCDSANHKVSIDIPAELSNDLKSLLLQTVSNAYLYSRFLMAISFPFIELPPCK